MLKWTSKSTLTSEDGAPVSHDEDIRHLKKCNSLPLKPDNGATVSDISDRPPQDFKKHYHDGCRKIISKGISETPMYVPNVDCSKTTDEPIHSTARYRADSIVSQISGLPFSYTDPTANHKANYPYLQRPAQRQSQGDCRSSDSHDQGTNDAGIHVSSPSHLKSTPNSPLNKPNLLSVVKRKRSKSVPRLESPQSSVSSLGVPKKGILSKVKKLLRLPHGNNDNKRSVSQPSSPTRSTSTHEQEKGNNPDTNTKQPQSLSTRLTRRIHSKRSQRRKTDLGVLSANCGKEIPITGEFYLKTKDLEVNGVDFSSDVCDMVGIDVSPHRPCSPTFETFKPQDTKFPNNGERVCTTQLCKQHIDYTKLSKQFMEQNRPDVMNYADYNFTHHKYKELDTQKHRSNYHGDVPNEIGKLLSPKQDESIENNQERNIMQTKDETLWGHCFVNEVIEDTIIAGHLISGQNNPEANVKVDFCEQEQIHMVCKSSTQTIRNEKEHKNDDCFPKFPFSDININDTNEETTTQNPTKTVQRSRISPKPSELNIKSLPTAISETQFTKSSSESVEISCSEVSLQACDSMSQVSQNDMCRTNSMRSLLRYGESLVAMLDNDEDCCKHEERFKNDITSDPNEMEQHYKDIRNIIESGGHDLQLITMNDCPSEVFKQTATKLQEPFTNNSVVTEENAESRYTAENDQCKNVGEDMQQQEHDGINADSEKNCCSKTVGKLDKHKGRVGSFKDEETTHEANFVSEHDQTNYQRLCSSEDESSPDVSEIVAVSSVGETQLSSSPETDSFRDSSQTNVHEMEILSESDIDMTPFSPPNGQNPPDTASNKNNAHISQQKSVSGLHIQSKLAEHERDDGDEHNNIEEAYYNSSPSCANTNVVVDMIRPDSLSPASNTDKEYHYSSSPMRVKSIVHRLEEQIKKKGHSSKSGLCAPQSSPKQKPGQKETYLTQSNSNIIAESGNASEQLNEALRLEVKNLVKEKVSYHGTCEESRSITQKHNTNIENAHSNGIRCASLDRASQSPCAPASHQREKAGGSNVAADLESFEEVSSADTLSLCSDIAEISSPIKLSAKDFVISDSNVHGTEAVALEHAHNPNNTEQVTGSKEAKLINAMGSESVASNCSQDSAKPGSNIDSSEDLLNCQGIIEITPLCPLVDTSNSTLDVKQRTPEESFTDGFSNVEHSAFLSNDGIHQETINQTLRDCPHLDDGKETDKLNGGTPSPVLVNDETMSSKPEYAYFTNQPKKRNSILSPSSKPPSPVKKTVSFKLDTPPPSRTASTSSRSDDVAICDDPITTHWTVHCASISDHKTGENRKEQSTAFVDADTLDMKSFSSPPTKPYQNSPGESCDDSSLSWCKLGCLDEADSIYDQKQPREQDNLIQPGHSLLDKTSGEKQAKFLPVSNAAHDKVNVIGTPDSKPTSFFLRNIKKYNITAKQNDLKDEDKSATNISCLHGLHVPINQETDTTPEQSPGSKFKDKGKSPIPKQISKTLHHKCDTFSELTESNSPLATYNINKTFIEKADTTHTLEETPINEGIDALVKNIDESSALSDLIDQLADSTICSSLQSPADCEIPSDSNHKQHLASAAKPTVISSQVPFWEKANVRRKIAQNKKQSSPSKSQINRLGTENSPLVGLNVIFPKPKIKPKPLVSNKKLDLAKTNVRSNAALKTIAKPIGANYKHNRPTTKRKTRLPYLDDKMSEQRTSKPDEIFSHSAQSKTSMVAANTDLRSATVKTERLQPSNMRNSITRVSKPKAGLTKKQSDQVIKTYNFQMSPQKHSTNSMQVVGHKTVVCSDDNIETTYVVDKPTKQSSGSRLNTESKCSQETTSPNAKIQSSTQTHFLRKESPMIDTIVKKGKKKSRYKTKQENNRKRSNHNVTADLLNENKLLKSSTVNEVDLGRVKKGLKRELSKETYSVVGSDVWSRVVDTKSDYEHSFSSDSLTDHTACGEKYRSKFTKAHSTSRHSVHNTTDASNTGNDCNDVGDEFDNKNTRCPSRHDKQKTIGPSSRHRKYKKSCPCCRKLTERAKLHHWSPANIKQATHAHTTNKLMPRDCEDTDLANRTRDDGDDEDIGANHGTPESEPAEWLFIATFFLFQILQHWLHATIK